LLSDNQETLDDTLKKGESVIKAEVFKWSSNVVMTIKTLVIQSLIEKDAPAGNDLRRIEVPKPLNQDGERKKTNDSESEYYTPKIISVSENCKSPERLFVSSEIPNHSTDNDYLERDNVDIYDIDEKVRPRKLRQRKKNQDDMNLDTPRTGLPQIKRTLSSIRKK
jgi:hypothetical protein